MDRKSGLKIFSKPIGRVLLGLALVGLFATAAPQPARADDAWAIFATWASQSAMWIQNQLQLGFGFASVSAGQIGQIMSNVQIADNANQNAAMGRNATKGMDIAVNYALDPNHSACAVLKGSMAKKEISQQSSARAAALSSSHPLANAATNVSDIKAACANGMSPATFPSDPSYLSNKSNGCSSVWGGHWEGANQTMNTLFAYNNMPVPDDFVLTGQNYQPITTKVTSEKYMPFVAALSYCQSLMPRVPPPPQGNGSSASLATIKQAYYDRDVGELSSARDVCMHLLAERMQISASNQNTGMQKDHASQAGKCKSDSIRGWADGDQQFTYVDGSTGSCQNDGRSELQMMFDEAHRDSSQTYQTVYLATLKPEELRAEERDLVHAQENIKDYVQKERTNLTTAISALGGITAPATSALERPMVQ